MQKFEEFIVEGKKDINMELLIQKIEKKSVTNWKKVLTALSKEQINFLYDVIHKTVMDLQGGPINNGKFIVNADKTIDVVGRVIITNTEMNKLTHIDKLPVVFNNIRGKFSIEHAEIKSLAGCPKKVEGDFLIQGCHRLSTLEGGPEIVSGSTYTVTACGGLKNLKGSPERVSSFNCFDNPKLESLEGAPQSVWNFKCVSAGKLKNLIGLPPTDPSNMMGGRRVPITGAKTKKGISSPYHLDVSHCPELESLEGAPDEVISLNISKCNKLTSLKYCPNVRDELDCRDCKNLKTIEHAKQVGELEISGCDALPALEKTLADSSEIFKKWQQSEETLPEFMKNNRGMLATKRFGL